jgi:hypothetical protein
VWHICDRKLVRLHKLLWTGDYARPRATAPSKGKPRALRVAHDLLLSRAASHGDADFRFFMHLRDLGRQDTLGGLQLCASGKDPDPRLGLLFALLPADRAARLDPAVLFRSAQ